MTKKSPAKSSAAKSTSAKPAPKVAGASDAQKIGKTQLVDLVVSASTLTKRDAALAVDALLESIVNALKAGQTVGLPGLGTLSVKATAARQGVNPSTKEKIQIPAGKKVAYKVATTLKSAL